MQGKRWVRHGFVYVPEINQNQRHASDELRYVVPYLTYSNLFGAEISLEEIVSKVRAFKLVDCIELYSKIETALENDRFENPLLQERLNNDLLPLEFIRRIPHGSHIYFSQQQILAMMKLVLLNNTNRRRKRLTEDQYIREMASCAL